MNLSHLTVVIPAFNEAEALPRTLEELGRTLRGIADVSGVDFVIVDDASTDSTVNNVEAFWREFTGKGQNWSLHLVQLQSNLGHQQAIQSGLRYLSARPFDACLIMDADGQDDPGAVAGMLQALATHDAVFARRTQRGEGPAWRLAYYAYQLIFRLMLGRTLPFGNFCLLAPRVVHRLSREGDLAHLAATITTYSLRCGEVPVARRVRSDGETKMSAWRLVDYGVAAMTASVPAWTRLFTRLAFLTAGLSIVGLVSVLAIKLSTNLAISGWASTICLLTFGISLQATGFMAMTAFLRRIMGHLAPVQANTKVRVINAAPNIQSQRESA